ncbi:MAG: NAD-dependent epimerase/dehydratase family protein [Burkholderiaceae bacterium]
MTSARPSVSRGGCLVTGATGFVGTALVRRLAADGWQLRAVSRANGPVLDATADWREWVAGCDVVVHTAARVHVMREQARDPLAEFRAVNRDGTLALAGQAARAGVRRFVFVSSAKVHGERSLPGRPLRADDPLAPADPYAVSKAEAETGLRALAADTAMRISIVRPPLVYGPGVGGNFATMLRWLERGLPLPLAAVDNRRSLLALDNLVDLLATCAADRAEVDRSLLASDGEDLSTPELLRRMAAQLGRRARLFAMPEPLLRAAAAAVGRRAVAMRLLDSLQLDAEPTRAALGWQPPLSVDAALAAVAAGR